MHISWENQKKRIPWDGYPLLLLLSVVSYNTIHTRGQKMYKDFFLGSDISDWAFKLCLHLDKVTNNKCIVVRFRRKKRLACLIICYRHRLILIWALAQCWQENLLSRSDFKMVLIMGCFSHQGTIFTCLHLTHINFDILLTYTEYLAYIVCRASDERWGRNLSPHLFHILSLHVFAVEFQEIAEFRGSVREFDFWV